MLERGLSCVRRFVYGDSSAKATKQPADTGRHCSQLHSKITLASQKYRRIRGEGYKVTWQLFLSPINQCVCRLP